MNNLNKYKASFFLAPAGWGKTSLIFDLYKRNDWDILFVSPLKCLEREVLERSSKIDLNGRIFKALTAEKVPRFLEKLRPSQKKKLLVVIDEIHLWNYWGSRFRERLWECFYTIANEGLPILGLTATLRDEYLLEWKELLSHGGYDFSLLDFGNGQMNFRPGREISYFGLSHSLFKRRLLFEIEEGGRCLIFCKFRDEVRELVKELNSFGVRAHSCVGGESSSFMENCELNGIPRVIVCTSTLSHGVNLGEVEKVFISYEILDWDLYLQMLARGGRKGGGFNVISKQKDKTSLWNKGCLWLFDRYLQLFYA